MGQTSLDLGPLPETTAWVPRRAAALDRLDCFTTSAGSEYARQRNFDFGAGKHGKVSQLSPWIRHRLILEEEVLRAVLQAHDLTRAEKFIQEVFWRGYFKGWLEHRPDVWRYYKSDLMDLFDKLEMDASLARRYDEAVSGRTGLSCFDTWARELIETGYLHNHARMWFASIWIYTLRLPWQLGADFFYRHLMDGDPASNTCSWRWVCGLHTIGKTYLARASNIEKFTGGRFNPANELANEAPALDDPRPIKTSAPTFVGSDFAGRRIGLIITEEDCCPELLGLSNPAAILAFSGQTERSLKPLGAVARTFAPLAVKDATVRAEEYFKMPVFEYADTDWVEALENWSRKHDLEGCLTSRLPQGPVQKRLRRACRDVDIDLIEMARPYDQAVWPYSKRGFFGLKKKIPSILSELGLP